MQNTATAAPASRTSHLVEFALKGLAAMYDPEKRFFCHRLVKTSRGMVREGISPRYTIMTLLGLMRAEAAGLESPIDVEETTDRLLADTGWVDNIGDLGLLLWLCAVSSPERLKRCTSTFDLSTALRRFPDARHYLTMELSWFLTGLAEASKAQGKSNFEMLARETYDLVRKNQGAFGLFGHMGTSQSLTGFLRGRVGSFADQVYPIIAMSYFSRVFGDEEARDNALRCANAICERQGTLGQWWWHYDSANGRVVEHFPVYSVHQHAMGPMALLAAEEAFDVDFQAPIHRGLKWINGANEMKQDLEDSDAGVVWRCITPPNAGSFTKAVRTLMGREPRQGAFEILYECRPYELGWLLYAFAGPSSADPSRRN
ncbi:MAG TPA: hypothetical protein VMB18_02640 [Terriglobales bacterium]|nr:hypothetical protein [Terriglobales bacterium]